MIPDGEDGPCKTCTMSSRLGESLTRWNWMRPVSCGSGGSVMALGVPFEAVDRQRAGAFRVRRAIPRDPATGDPFTFENLALTALGTKRLAVLKADVDDMGERVGKIAREDASLRKLRCLSRNLHAFFSDTIQDLLADSWHTIYTVFAGGDDLLLIGPWNIVFDFAQALHQAFNSGPGREYPGLTFSAGIAVTPHRLPIRHAIGRAEELLASAKRCPGKNRCSSLGATWSWDRHPAVLADGQRLCRAITEGAASRSLVQRLLTILEPDVDPEMRAARWNYHVQRGSPRCKSEIRSWADRVLELMDDPRTPESLAEPAASIRYALLATRSANERETDAR